jgi:hypothetical protein
MKSHQRIIRERHAQEPDPLLEEKLLLSRSFDRASVREVPKKVAPVVTPASTTATAPTPTPAPVAAPTVPASEPTPTPEPEPTSAPALAVAPAPALVFTKTEIEQIVLQYLREHATTVEMRATAEPTEAESGLQPGEIPGSHVPLYVPSATMIPPDPNSELEVLTQEQIEEKLNRDLAAEIERRQGRRAPNPQSAITFSKPTGRDEWTRR